MVSRHITRAVLALSLVACDAQPSTPPDDSDATTTSAPVPDFADVFQPRPDPALAPMLDARATLVRLSLDLRGVRPTAAELDQLDGLDPAAAEQQLAAYVDAFLADPRFGDSVRDLFAGVLRTRVEDFPLGADALGLGADRALEVSASIADEPLHILSRVATEDRPWSEIVTVDWTMADALLAAVYPIGWVGERQAGWSPARYLDGRPSAGVLSTNGFWFRYLSDGVNYGRGRANAIARVFLCADFLDRPVDFPRDIDLTDEAGIREAVRANEGCIGCHAALDPLASYLAGFQYTEKTAAEMVAYHPEREREWRAMTELAPGYFGRPGYVLTDLGHQIAADPRFVQCAVETTFELLLRRPVDFTDAREVDALTAHREAFLAGGLRLKALIRSIVADPRYRMAETPDGVGAAKLVTPEQWSAMLASWTGYRFTLDGTRDVLSTDEQGVRMLAGGGDARSGAGPARVPTATMSLVWERTAEAAAAFATRVDAPRTPDDLVTWDLDAEPEGERAVDDADFRAHVVMLHRSIFGTNVASDSLEVSATLALWDQIHAIDGARPAWAAVLTALFRDPSLTLY